MSLSNRKRILVVIYIGLFFLTALPALDICFNTAELFLMIPISVLWLVFCLLLFVVLAIWAYFYVFVPDSKRLDDVFNLD